MECYIFSELAGAFASLACAWFGSAHFAACPAKLRDSSYRIPEAVGLAAGVLAMLPMMFLFGYFFRRIRTALSDWVVS